MRRDVAVARLVWRKLGMDDTMGIGDGGSGSESVVVARIVQS